VAELLRQVGKRLEQAFDVLSGLDGAVVDDGVCTKPGNQGTGLAQCPGGVRGWAEHLRAGGADHADALLGHPQVGDDIVGCRARQRDDVVRRTDQLAARPVAGAGPRIGQVDLGEELGDEVVDRHTRRIPAADAGRGQIRRTGVARSKGDRT